MKVSQERKAWMIGSAIVLVLVVLAALFWPKEEPIAPTETVVNQDSIQTEFNNHWYAFSGDLCEITGDLKRGKIEFIKIPKGKNVTLNVKGKSYSGEVPEDSWVLNQGGQLKTVDGVLENAVLSNFDNLRKEGYKIMPFPEKACLKDVLYFCQHHEFDAKLKFTKDFKRFPDKGGYHLANLDDLDQSAHLTDTLYFNPECMPKWLAIKDGTNEQMGVSWDGNCWRPRELSQKLRGEMFYPEGLNFHYLLDEVEYKDKPRISNM